MTRIKIKDLSFAYEEKQIFQNFSLELDERPTAIIGENGAGKTTLMKLLNGLLKAQSGSIEINGQPTAEKEVAELASEVGYVFQNPNDQIFKSRVLDEVTYGALNLGKSKEEAKQAAEAALDEFDLMSVAEENPYDLSLSERKQIAIASILAMDTQVIIFDEPTIGQDLKAKKQLKELIQRLKESGKVVIAILHDMSFVAETFERVVVLKDGEVLADGTSQEVFSQEEILNVAGLELPPVAALSKVLEFTKLALTVEEFLEMVKVD